MGHLFKFARRHQKGHALETTLKLVLRRIGFILDIVVIIIFMNFSHDRKFIRMLQIEKQLDWALPTAYGDCLPANDC
jgi:hypothetical protein